jgi:hypothetical protein
MAFALLSPAIFSSSLRNDVEDSATEVIALLFTCHEQSRKFAHAESRHMDAGER